MSPSTLKGTLLFHLNLSYSAIEVEQRDEVIQRCYWPLLQLVDRFPWLTLAIEAPGATLEIANALDPAWVAKLRLLIDTGRVEWVGSGDSQLIGPLVPASVNEWNQKLGQDVYAKLLGRNPSVALVNEMAWSQGIIDAYGAAGYRTLIMEWNNPRRAHAEWEDEWRFGVVRTSSPTGHEVEVVWADAVAFQKIQRAVAGDLDVDDYVDWVMAHESDRPRHLFVYANDAEIFDYRPGRFRAEPALESSASEWDRLAEIIEALHARGLEFTAPSQVVADERLHCDCTVVLNAAADPVPVKKQPKYNASRWGLTGHDDVGINARCFAQARVLEARASSAPAEWRELCRAWGSDVRTHLTEDRWSVYEASPGDGEDSTDLATPARELKHVRVRRGERALLIETDDVVVTLLPRRGLSIESLIFPSVSAEPLCGTIPHGFFDEIDWAADFYTGHAVLDIPARQRITDLGRSEPDVRVLDDRIVVTAEIGTDLGPLQKTVTVFADHVDLHYGFSVWGERVPCSLRAGFITLLPGGLGENLWAECANGGAVESFPIEGNFDHGASVSSLVSSSALFGATGGSIGIHDGNIGLELSWPNWRTAALPQLTSRRLGQRRFVRVAFSLAEIDETHRPGASLHDFQLSVRATRIAA